MSGGEGRRDRRKGGQRQSGKCRIEMKMIFFVKEISAEHPPPPDSVFGATSALTVQRCRRQGSMATSSMFLGFGSAGVFLEIVRKIE